MKFLAGATYVYILFAVLKSADSQTTNVLDPAFYCNRGPGNCATVFCRFNSTAAGGSIYDCVFAPLNTSESVYIGSGGQWNGAAINNLNITKSSLTLGNRCLKNIVASTQPPPVTIHIQFDVPQTSISNTNKVVFQNYESCVSTSKLFSPATMLNQFPNDCLKLSRSCNFTATTTPTSPSATTTPITSAQTGAATTTMAMSTSSLATSKAITSNNSTPRISSPVTLTTATLQSTAHSTTVSLAVTTITNNQLTQIVNKTIAAEISSLNLTQAGKQVEVKNITTPTSGTLQNTTFNGLTSPAATDPAQAAVVAREFQPQSTNNLTAQNTDMSLTTSVAPFPGSPMISIVIVDLITGKVIGGRLSYTITMQDAPSRAQAFVKQTVADNSKHNGKFGVTKISKVETPCGFFNTKLQKFSTSGCRNTASNSTSVSCYCDHTTLFAVLLSVQTYNIPSAVKLISYVTESITVACLIITIATLVSVRKKVRSDRTVVQINLSIALLCFHVLNVVNEWALGSNAACVVVTVTTHYFLLATGMWMLLEGLTLFVKTTDRILSLNKKNPKKIATVKLVLGWGIPLLIVVLAVAIGFPTGRYMDESQSPQYQAYLRCWVGNAHNALLASVIIPMAAIYLANVIIAARVIWFVHKLKRSELRPSGSKQGEAENIGAAMKVFLMLFPVLGVPLLFAFLTSVQPYQASVVFMYINVVLNGLQGLFLLLVYCVLASEVREAVDRSYERFKLRHSDDVSKTQTKANTSTYSTTAAS